MISKFGILLLFVGLALMIHAQCNLEITSGAEAVFGSEDATIYDAGLICEKLNLTIIAGIVLISAIIMALANPEAAKGSEGYCKKCSIRSSSCKSNIS